MPPKTKLRTPKKRLDLILVERGLAESRQRAQALLLAGRVFVAGQRIEKAGAQVAPDAAIEIAGDTLPFVSRGGVKLAGALDDFGLAVEGKTCLDVGSSTGGFTDCLLQRGARRVYALDVSPEQLAWKLRQDPRVLVIDRNARFLRAADIPEPADLVAVDVSFISVTKILPAVATAAKPDADFLVLVKPQFELQRSDVGKGGIVRDAKLHERAVERVRAAAEQTGLHPEGVRPSHLTGAEGNQEFFLHARRKV